MLKTKSLHEPYESTDGKRILVSYYWPTSENGNHIDIWFKELGSPMELVKNWPKRSFTHKEFLASYGEQLSDPKLRPLLQKIAEEGYYNTVTLLCHCKKDSYCHRSLLKSYLENL